MQIRVNGETKEVPHGTTIADLAADYPPRGVAVAVNGTVIPRADHAQVVVDDGWIIEIVSAVQGG